MKLLNIKAKIAQVYPDYYLLPHNAVIQKGDLCNAKENFDDSGDCDGWQLIDSYCNWVWIGRRADYKDKKVNGKNLIWIRSKHKPLSLYETVKRIYEIVDTSQDCSKGNEEIAVLAGDAVSNFKP